MTRETKIGLLVGLAFIIVVAILLTDHASSTTDPRPATLSEAGPNVRQSVTTPGAPPSPVSVGADAPRAPVPTRGDLATPPTAGGSTASGGQSGGQSGAGERSSSPISVNGGSGKSAGGDVVLPPIEVAKDPGSAGRSKAGRGSPADLVAQHPDDLTRVGGGRTDAATKTPAPPVTPSKTYTAEPGDSINRIASKMKGGNTKANRDALLKANPSLQGDGAVVYVGRSYVIPSPGAAAQAADVPPSPVGTVGGGKTATPVAPAGPAAVANTTWYTVKDNDNLWRIASRELGDGNLWTAVRDINKDVLKGGETVKANMRIRLPKGTATASVN